VNYQTVNRYVDILEQAFLIRRILPYAVNIGKRLTKRPRFMFRDTGLLHYFLGIQTAEDLADNPARGYSWESFLTEQVLQALRTVATRIEPFFWRTAGGAEVDLLVRADSRLLALEFKLHSAPSASMIHGLRECMKDLAMKRGFLLYPGTERYGLGHGIEAMPASMVLEKPGILLE
jgi:predicted AAA+ superfamily ATPase